MEIKIEHRLTHIEACLEGMRSDVVEIKESVRSTNGLVREIQGWRMRMEGAMALGKWAIGAALGSGVAGTLLGLLR